jgi:hypothetical protein
MPAEIQSCTTFLHRQYIFMLEHQYCHLDSGRPADAHAHRAKSKHAPSLHVAPSGVRSKRARWQPARAPRMQMALLGVALIVGRVLERNNVHWLSEAGGALIVGVAMGVVVTLAKNLNHSYYSLFKFNVRAAAAMKPGAAWSAVE